MILRYKPSAELSLLLKAATIGCRNRPANDTNDDWQKLDWDRLLKLANFHGLSCWLAEYLKDVDYVPSDISKKLLDKRRRQLLSLTFVEQQKSKLLTTLRQNDIRFAILKGGAIAKPLYKERWYYRSMADLDVLIDPVQLKLAFEQLKGIGYRDLSHNALGEVEFEIIATCHQQLRDIEHSLIFPKQQFCLDVHWKLRKDSLLPIPYETLFSNIVQDSTEVSRLAKPIEFVHICVHGMDGGWRKLKGLIDVLYYADNISDWSMINETAQRLGVLHVINTSLALCDFFYGTNYGPKQLSKREQTLFRFVISGFERDNEQPRLHSYLDRRNIYAFIKTTLSWWLALSSDLVSTTTILKHLLIPNKADLTDGQLSRNNQITFSIFIRLRRVLKKYFFNKD